MSDNEDVWVRTHEGGLIRATAIHGLTHTTPAPQSGYVVKTTFNGGPVALINNTEYQGTVEERQKQAKSMQDSLLLAVNHGGGKFGSYVVSYDSTAERWKTEQLDKLPGIFQPVGQ